MDDKLDKILKLLEEKKNKYPNITNVWKRLINNQIQYLQDTLSHCENIFVNIDNEIKEDLKPDTILFLYLLKNLQHNNDI